MLVARNNIRAATGLAERAFDRFEKKAVITPLLVKEGTGSSRSSPAALTQRLPLTRSPSENSTPTRMNPRQQSRREYGHCGLSGEHHHVRTSRLRHGQHDRL